MPAQALSSEFLESLAGREPAYGAVNYFDTEIKGFLLEHRASGGMTFYFRYRDVPTFGAFVAVAGGEFP